MVCRIFVEKRPGLDNEARGLASDINELLQIESVKKVRLFNRYDVDNITKELFDYAVDTAETAGLISKGDVVVLTAGVPLGVSGTTNLIKVQVAGHILVKGKGIAGKKIAANLCVCHSEEDLANFKEGDIIVAADTNNRMMEQMRQASGLIVEADSDSCHAAIAGLSLDIPVLIGAKNALEVLKSSAYVELDSENGVVTAI